MARPDPRRPTVRLVLIENLEGRALLSAALPEVAALSPGSYDPTRILVGFRNGAAGVDGAKVLPGTAVGKAVGLNDNLREVALKPGVNVNAALAAYQKNPNVAYAEPNWVYTTQATSDDPYFTGGSLWGMYGDQSSPSNAFGSRAAEAWSAGNTGSGDVYIGIIDEGVDYTHPDLVSNVWTNNFDPIDGVDNDKNGYVDDIHGWDFNGNDNTVYDGPGDDHGTHVAGTIAAAGGNGIGVAGMSWGAKIIPAKFLGSAGGTTADAILALDYFVDLKTRHGLNIVATNNSWGGGGFSQGLLDAITRAAKQDILFIAAAGNGGSDGRGDNNDSFASYPSNYDTTAGAGYDAVIAVAAIDQAGGRASFSNYGAKTVDLGAPGVGINSTLPDKAYGSYSGTSMATPHVAGAAALYASANPGATAATIKKAILDTARSTPTSSMQSKTVTGGRLNVESFLPTGPQVPASPNGLSASPSGQTQINLAWVDNSSNEAGFQIDRSSDGVNWAPLTTVASGSTSHSDAGLATNTKYWYRVSAFNTDGASSPSNIASATTGVVLVGAGVGLTGRYYTDGTLTSLKATRVDADVNFNWGSGSPMKGIKGDNFSVRWTGQVQPTRTEAYTFYAKVDDNVRLWINGVLVIRRWGSANTSEWKSAAISLDAGKKYNVQMDFREISSGASAYLRWASHSTEKQLIPTSQLYKTSTADIYTDSDTTNIGIDNGSGATLSVQRESGYQTGRAASFATTPLFGAKPGESYSVSDLVDEVVI